VLGYDPGMRRPKHETVSAEYMAEERARVASRKHNEAADLFKDLNESSGVRDGSSDKAETRRPSRPDGN